MDDEEATRHNRYHEDTERVLITFRGSHPADVELLQDLRTLAGVDRVKLATVIRTGLAEYVKTRCE